MMDIDKLKQEIDTLKEKLSPVIENNQLEHITLSRKNKISKVSSLEKEYKSLKKRRSKSLTVKNLMITSNIALILVPFVLFPITGGIIGWGIDTDFQFMQYEQDASVYNEYITYYDSTGKSVILDEDVAEKIIVETPFVLVKDNLYERKVYQVETFIDSEEKNAILNSDYTSLLGNKKYDFSNPVVEIKELNQIDSTDASKIAVIDKEKVLLEEKKEKIGLDDSIGALMCGVVGFVAGCMSLFGCDSLFGRIDETYRKHNKVLSEIPKSKIKDLKKKYKKENNAL